MARPWLFEIGAFLYGVMTAQTTWRASCARLARYMPDQNGLPDQRILDLGCGPGVSSIILARSLPHAWVVGVDLAPRMLDAARHYTDQDHLQDRISYVLADAAALPFADSAFSLVTGHSFLYLVHDRVHVVQQAYHSLRRGGRIASMEPRKGNTDWGSIIARHWREIRYLVSVILWRPYSRWHGQFDAAGFRELYASAGFKNIGSEIVLDGLGLIGCGEKE